MSCSLTSGYSLGCRDSIGGIIEAYIGNFDSDITYTTGTNSIITGFTGGTVSYQTFEQEQQTGEFNQNGQYSTENGTVFYEQSLTLMLHKNDAALINQFKILSQMNGSVLIKDQRGKYFLMGKQNGVRVTEGSMNTGRAFGDMNGVTITFTANEPEPADEISWDEANFSVA